MVKDFLPCSMLDKSQIKRECLEGKTADRPRKSEGKR